MTLNRRDALALLAATGIAAAAPRARALPDVAQPRLRRAYVDTAAGQVHLRIAMPEKPKRGAAPLVLMHQTPLSGRMFERIMPHLAARRTVIAVDTPGYGESDRPAERMSCSAYADAVLEAAQKVAGRCPLALLGYHTGAVLAADLAARGTRDVAALVLVSMPYFDEARRLQLVAQLDAPDGPGEPFADDGSHLTAQWKGSFDTRAPAQSVDDVARLVAEKQRPGRYNEWALRAAMDADLTPMLARIAVPTLVLAPHDGLQSYSARAAAAIAGAKLIDLPDQKYGLFDGAPALLAGHILPFLGG